MGDRLRTTLRFGLIQLLLVVPAIAVVVIGVIAFASFDGSAKAQNTPTARQQQ